MRNWWVAELTLLGSTALVVCLFAGWANSQRAHITVSSRAHTCVLTTTYEDGHTFRVVWDDPRDCDRLNRSSRARP